MREIVPGLRLGDSNGADSFWSLESSEREQVRSVFRSGSSVSLTVLLSTSIPLPLSLSLGLTIDDLQAIRERVVAHSARCTKSGLAPGDANTACRFRASDACLRTDILWVLYRTVS